MIAVTRGRLALALAVLLGSTAASAATLMQPSRAAANAADPVVAGLRGDRSVAAVDPMQVDVGALAADAASVDLVLPGKGRVTLWRTGAEQAEDGSLIWNGVVSASAPGPLSAGVPDTDRMLNSATLVKGGGQITGNVQIAGQLYRLLPTAAGHVLAKIDASRMPPDHPAEEYKRLFVENIGVEAPAKPAGEAGTKAVSTIRVMVVVTNAAAAQVGNVTNFVNLAINETKAGYTNSGVEISMQLAGVYTTSYVESGSFSTDLARFRGTTDGYMDSVHSLRNTNAADMVMLVINNSSSCGLASAIGASASTAFAAVHHGCATGYYSFGHELGHLQSARHDPANDPTSTPYAYGHGYQYPSGGWRTIMAYACASVNCTRLNYWSNPAKTRSGVPMGTTSSSHNQRVLNNTKATIAAFR